MELQIPAAKPSPTTAPFINPSINSPPSQTSLSFALRRVFFFSLSLIFLLLSAMKLNKLNPRNLFCSKKDRSAPRSDPTYFSSGSSASSVGSSSNLNDSSTPKSVIPWISHEKSIDWPDFSADIHYDLVEAFKLIDKDGDGKITRSELENLLSRVGAEPPSEEELVMMFSDVDLQEDGFISLQEIRSVLSALPPSCDSDLLDAFHIFDADRDGMISAEELWNVFTAIGDDRCTLEDCRRMISRVDSNGDGFVRFEDFTRMMEEHEIS